MRFILLCLWLALVPVLAVAQQAESPSMRLLLRECPRLTEGGDSVESFASWANGRYLLWNSLYVGPVTSIGNKVHAELFLRQHMLVLAFWAGKESSRVSITHGADAKCYSWGDHTRVLKGKRLDITSTAFPQFVQNVTENYLLEATALTRQQAELSDSENDSLLMEVQRIFGKADADTFQRQLSITGEITGDNERIVLGQLEVLLDRLLLQCLASPVKKDRVKAHLAFRLVRFRLRILETHLVLLQWQRLLPHDRPFSDLERIRMLDTVLPQLSKASPKEELRGLPEVSELLRSFIADLARTGKTFLPREQSRCLYLLALLPGLAELESPTVQNLQITLLRNPQYTGIEYVLSILNQSHEEATGTLIVSWATRNMEIPMTLTPGKYFSFSLGSATGLPLDTAIRISGELADHTAINPVTILVNEVAETQK